VHALLSCNKKTAPRFRDAVHPLNALEAVLELGCNSARRLQEA
jgi:hypothetical protein